MKAIDSELPYLFAKSSANENRSAFPFPVPKYVGISEHPVVHFPGKRIRDPWGDPTNPVKIQWHPFRNFEKTIDIGAMICYHTDLHQTRKTGKGGDGKGPEEGRGFPPGGEISEGRGKEGGKGLGKGPGRGFEKEAPESHGIAPANVLYTTASYASILLWFAVLTAAVHGKGSFSRRNQADRQ